MSEKETQLLETPEPQGEVTIPPELPILPIKTGVVFPFMIVPLIVSDSQLIQLIDDSLGSDKLISVATQSKPEVENPGPDDLYRFGTASLIVKMLRFPDGSLRILVQGVARVRITRFTQMSPYMKARVDVIKESKEKSLELEALARNAVSLFQKVVSMAFYLPDELQAVVLNIQDESKLADFIASNVNFEVADKQSVLEAVDLEDRFKRLIALLSKEVSVLELGAKIRSEVKTELDKDQREYYLREQLKAIQRELGEEDERAAEKTEIAKKIEAAGMPEEVKGVALAELDRLSRMPLAAAEYTVSRTYLDWLVSLPWSKQTEDNLNVKGAEKILDEDHYDLQDVKERMLEYLAVRKLKKDTKGPILCFVGPPGVGKTSLGRSIARALGREFVRLSLGGVRDEAEIRGHRRTYVGALPGRIIQGIRKAGSRNPVFMLDEVDKIGADFRGDPAAALLEVLDPEQNHSFSDHYLEVAFDLSKVMFITTANIADPIPPALKDRMEILELPGYTLEEKILIAQKFLVPRQISENGLSPDRITFKDEAIGTIINEHTREAGVRNLEREIASICRKVAKKVAAGDNSKFDISKTTVSKMLGPRRYYSEVAARTGEVGVATGLAWTPTGGEILFVEATKMRGRKSLTLTGHLGDVMKESAQAALSYIRSDAGRFGIDNSFFDKYDIHIHVPAGSIPKDGPSAGIAMAVALTSLLTGRKVKPAVAMSGEITLSGKVLPIGGVKEKVLAAKRSGIKQVILPDKNKKDLQEIPARVRKGLKFHFVDRIDKAIELAVQDRKKR
ncbi:MAG: endopeptidase La [bacterium]